MSGTAWPFARAVLVFLAYAIPIPAPAGAVQLPVPGKEYPRTGRLREKYKGPMLLTSLGEVLRRMAVFAPLPEFPAALARERRQGLVVVEVAVGPEGTVIETNFLQSFSPEATRAVENALREWMFFTNDQMAILAGGVQCPGCIRVAALAFDFVFRDGRPVVVDLPDEENRRHKIPSDVDKVPKTPEQLKKIREHSARQSRQP
ncbi:MAG: energy transducer TonB [Bryobacteraceae bacterium]|jgi:hypothetical protein